MGNSRLYKKNRFSTTRWLYAKKLARQRWQHRRAALASPEERTVDVNLQVETDLPVGTGLHEELRSDESESMHSDCTRQTAVESEGRYIVNIAYMLEQLHEKFDNHDPTLICGFRDMVQTNLRRYGLQTQIFFKCRVCNFKDSIWTDRTDGEAMDINRSAVAGTIAMGIGLSQLEELLASMSVPCMSMKTYRKYDMEMIAAFEKAAEAEMQQAAEIAKKLALERGDFIVHDGKKIPFLTVVADCSWMTRSYNTGKYDSLSGVGVILNKHTNKVIHIGVRNKYCCICEWAAKHDVTPKEHKCFKNWGRDQASTEMESDALLGGFPMDNDPYSRYGIIVERKECVNHLLRNLARKIRDIQKTKGRKISHLKKLAVGSVLKFRQTIQKAILHHQKHEENGHADTTRIDLLRKDVLNAPYHVFGDHRRCNTLDGFCHQESTDEEISTVEELKRAGLFQQLEDAITYLSFHADSLLYNATNNMAESFNAIVCKLIGGKRINFGLRGSFQARCAEAVLQHNTQNILTKLHESEGKEPPSTVTNLEVRRQRKVRNTAELREARKASRALEGNENRRQRGQDKNYGQNAQQVDRPAWVYDDLEMLHYDRLLENKKNRTEIEKCTRGQADNSLWQTLRRKILTASNFGEVCRMRDTTSCSATVMSILYPTLKSTPGMVWGRTNEERAIQALQDQLADEGKPMIVRSCGLFIDPKLEFLGASPDGIIDDNTIVEVKCPKSAQGYHPEDAIQQGVTEIPKYFDRKDPSKMNTSHPYYYQVQGQLHVTRADTCYFAVWSPLGLKYVKVIRDDAFWSKQMEPHLTRFYKECLLPEIIDPRKTRNMPIREPKYVLDARQLRNQAVETSQAGKQGTRGTTTPDSQSDTTTDAANDGSLLYHSQSKTSESEMESRETRQSKKVRPLKIIRKNPKDEDSWSVTSTDEESRLPGKVLPLKLLKRTSGDGVSWVVSSDETNKPRIPPLKVIRSFDRRNSWVVSSSDDQLESAHRGQTSGGTPPVAPTPRGSSPTETANERDVGIPWVVVSDNRVAMSPTREEIDILESVNLNVNIADIRRDVLSSNSLLDDTSIDQHLSVMKKTTQYHTATSLWLTHQRFIKPTRKSQDLHIIGGNAFRHWRCLHFDGTQLLVYDSLGCHSYQSLQEEERRFITQRYPNLQSKDVVFPVVQRQPDNFSCGVFAAAFATTVALGGNPMHAVYSKNVMELRNHFLKIIENEKLSPFPNA